jgi:ssDNA-binding Zn-finger/Zn-ribbon topoisomerase 1
VAEKGVCPVCGSAVTERNGKYGLFISCTDYPYCKWHTTPYRWKWCEEDPVKWLGWNRNRGVDKRWKDKKGCSK